MTPADILATAVFAALGMYAAYRIVDKLADKVIDSINSLTRFERN